MNAIDEDYTSIEVCPACKVNLIYKRDTFRAWSRAIGVRQPEIFDGVLYWMCPDCNHVWHRFPAGDRLREAATQWVRTGDPE